MAGRGVWERRQLQFIGAPFCDGQNLAGADLAPAAFREAGFAALAAKQGWEVFDDGDLDIESHGDSVARRAERERNVAVYRLWVRHGMPGAFACFLRKHTGASHEPTGEATHAAPVAAGDPYDKVVNGPLVGAGMKAVYDSVKAAAEKGRFVLNVGGDHSIGAPSVAAMASVHQDLAVIWVDAHADANTPATSPSLHYHGMPVAHVLGWFARNPRGFEWWPGEECPAPADASQDPEKRRLFPNTMRGLLAESRFAYIGLRDVDETEADMLRHSGVHVYTMREVDKCGIAACIKMALTAVDPNANRPLHLSLDVDAIDPAYAPGTGTLARGGLSYREVHYLAEEVALTRRCVSMDLVEVNPVLDAPQPELAQGMHGDPSCMQLTTATVHLAMEIALSALGRSILSHTSKL